jgi:hypothetical protein
MAASDDSASFARLLGVDNLFIELSIDPMLAAPSPLVVERSARRPDQSMRDDEGR